MFTFKRDMRIRETLKLGRETLHISFDAFKVLREFNAKYVVLAEAEKKAVAAVGTANADAIFEAYGNAIFAIMDLFFGEEVRKKIVEFYENNYVEMTEVVLPYITKTLLPKITKIVNEQKTALAQRYGTK